MKRFLLLISCVIAVQIVFGQLTGTKTIPGDYATIEAAITALNAQGAGSGGVTFSVAAGHTETFSVPTAGLITTTTGSSTSPIFFQKSGAGANPLITAATPGSGTMDYVICLSGADYVTFDGIDIQENAANTTSAMQMEWAFAILKASETNGSQNNVIKNSSISLNPANTSSRAIYSNNHTTASTTQLVITDIAGTNSYNRFFSLNVSNCYHAFYIYGRADAAPYDFYDQNNELGVEGTNVVNGLGNSGGTTACYGLYCYYQNNIKIANNNFTGTADLGSASLYNMYLMTSTNANVEVYNNTISMTYNGTGSFYGIYNSGMGSSGTTNTVNYNNNSVINNQLPNHTSGTVYLMYISTGGVTAYFHNNTVSGNEIGSGTSTSTGSIYYCYFSSSPSTAGTTQVYNNTVTNNSRRQSVVGGGANYLFYVPGSGTILECHDNIVDNINIASSGTTYGLYVTNSAVTKNIYGNTVKNLFNGNGTLYSTYLSGGTTVNFYGNEIKNANKVSATGTLYGIYVSTGTNVYLYNNFISELYAPASTLATSIYGIYFSGGTSHGAYNNTIYLDASSSSDDFGTIGLYASTTPILELKNNIIVNVSTPGVNGTTIAYRRSSTTIGTYATTSNNNNFYAGTPGPSRLIYSDGTNNAETLMDYKALVSPADAASVAVNPAFQNKTAAPYNLHMRTNVPSQLESGGITVSTPVDILTDFDGDARYPNAGYPVNASFPPTAPDIGADEFGGLGSDLTAPSIQFTQLPNTASLTQRTLVTTITDASGVPTAGSGLPMLYWKINNGAYTAVQATYLGTDQYSFTLGAGVAVGDVVSYYLVAQDEADPLNIGAMPAAGASGYTSNPPACSTPPDPPLTYTILLPLCGTFQVGTGGDYATLTAAIADLVNYEVTCPVVFELTDATYDAETVPIVLLPVAGASSANTITIRPASGASPTITGSGTSIIKFEGGQYYVFDGSNVPGGTTRNLTIENTATSTSTATIWISSLGVEQGSSNNTIKNCHIKGGSNTVTSQIGIFVGGTSISTSGTGADNDGITIENNRISRAYYGLIAHGLPAVGELDNLVVKNNTIGADVDTDYITGYGMRFQSINGAVVSDNEIYNMIYNGSKYGLYTGTTIANSLFHNNHIHAMGQTNTTASYYCIAMYFATTTGTVNNQVSNNLIYDLDMYGSTSNFYGPIGIRIVGGNGYKVWHNTISLTGAFGSTTAGVYSHCLFISTATSNIDVRNNIFSNTRTGVDPRAYTVYTPSTTTFAAIDYNDYYTTGSAFGYYGAEVADFTAWKAATGQDFNSENMNPNFVSPTNPLPTNTMLNNQGVYLPDVPKDFTGQNRTSPPDMGAYEFGNDPDLMTMPATSVTPVSATLNASVNPVGQNVSTYFDYGFDTNYGNSVAGVPSSVTGNSPTAYSADLAGLTTSAVYHFRARVIGAGGLIIYGDDMTFETVPPPTVTTQAATGITSTGATLNGLVNANNSNTMVYFEYGPTDSYGTVVPAVPAQVSGSTDVAVTVDLSGLEIFSTYHYRVYATNSGGTSYGSDMTFTTLGELPVVVTNPASNVLISTAQLNGTVTANNQETTVTFEWGLTPAYGNVANATPLTVNGMSPTAVSAQIAGLLDNTEYHFRCVGTNAEGTTYGADQMFNTYCPPPAAAGPITGPQNICKPSAGNVYTVAPIQDATTYVWTVPAGATITAGAGTNSITVSFDETSVSGDITVYGSSNCGNGAQSSLAVAVNPLPVPTITGADPACLGSIYTYSTEAGMSSYVWTVSAGGQIIAGAGTATVDVQWNSTGAQSLSVTYTSAAGCPAAAPAVMPVQVSGLPSPTISGSNMMCANSGLFVYTTEQGFSDYSWTVSTGGTIVSGQGTYQIEVNWTTPGSKTVTVNYDNASGCPAATPASFAVTVMGVPVAPGAITGVDELCMGQNASYSVAPVAGALSYDWTVPAGATIFEGEGTPAIKVFFGPGASSGNITVAAVNNCGNGPASPAFFVTVNPIPPAPVVTVDGDYLLTSSAPDGNQWYFNGNPIEGATGQTHQAEEEGFYWTIVTLNGCSSQESNHVEVIFVGIDELPGTSLNIFPIPNSGKFTVAFVNKTETTYQAEVVNHLGIRIYEKADVVISGQGRLDIDLGNVPKGIYTLTIRTGQSQVMRKIIVTR